MINKYNTYLIVENLQLAESRYFKTGLLNDEEKQIILDITGSDQYTKILCDLLYDYKKYGGKTYDELLEENIKNLKSFYNLLKGYDNNVFPIKDFDVYNKKELDVDKLYKALIFRNNMIKILNEFPSIAKRNLKSFITKKRDVNDFRISEDDFNLFDYLHTHLELLKNKNENVRNKIYQKIFRSGYSLDDMVDFVENKKNLLDDKEITESDIEEIVENNPYLEIVYNENDVIVVEVSELDGIKAIGCNSLWCFTYGENNWSDWNEYSYDGLVYVIFDFKKSYEDEDFMTVVIKPLDEEYDTDENTHNSPIYNMINEPIYSYKEYLKSVFGDVDYLEFINFIKVD